MQFPPVQFLPISRFVPIRRAGSAVALALVLIASGCGSDSTDESTTTSDPSLTTNEAPAGQVAFDQVWARTTPDGSTRGAIYLTITSAQDNALVSASVDPSVAATVEIHETTMADDAGSDEEGAMEEGAMEEGAMTMREVASIPLPAGKAVALKPGGLHIMLFDLAEPLSAGDEFEATLTFEDGQTSVVDVVVSDNPPA